ncbi:uncharacterized protein LOC115755064 isoform X2 [Rhodamnia argentea]|uniref:Uncharacterized protein LOC115755064 isoform X2 n=1 Tax=Rhodamnia argentea TaxID=178133 RepID=A0ABM3H0J6_9MYRT|nr:uncharacterized protein LOC115755064 isoform X2 [Rhodamnia argentea]
MAQENQAQKCSNSSSGGNITIGSNNSIRSSKKQKQKKAPQRGLGVAQLEKIRIEEQQKRDAAAIFPSPATISQGGSCYLPAPLANYHIQGDFALTNSIFRPVPPHPVQNFEVPSAGAFPLVNQGRGCGLETDRQSGAMIVPEHFPYMWNFPEYSGEIKTSLMDPGSQLCSRPSLPIDPGWPSLGPVRKGQYDCPPLLVNASPMTSSAPSLNYQMEPPSNQSHLSNYFPALPLEEKMIGVKRSYPFSLENSPAPYYPFKLPVLGHPNGTPDEPYSRGIGNFSFRESPSCPPLLLESNLSKSIKSSGTLGGEFLTLGPPATSTPLNSKQPPALLTLNDQNVPDSESQANKGSQEGLGFHQASNWRHRENPCYNFLAPAMVPNNQANTCMNNCNSNPGASIDLNLRL